MPSFKCIVSVASSKHAREDNTHWRGRLPEASSYDAPRFCCSWPGGWIEPEVFKGEIEAIALAGFRGAEISDVRDSIPEAMDPQVYGWAQERWNAGALAAYQAGQDQGIHIDYTLEPHWPTGVPGYTPDTVETAKELIHGQILLQAGTNYSGPLPLPVANPSGQNNGNPNDSTVTDVSQHYKNETLTWTVPPDGPYVIVAIYGRGTGQVHNMYDMNSKGPQLTEPAPAYIVDHLFVAGMRASVKYWNEHVLTDELRPLMNTSQGSLSEDSLELKLKQYWTPSFLDEFEKRRGYDLTPYLLYLLKDTNNFSGDSVIAQMVDYDFYSTVTDLYIDYRLTYLQRFRSHTPESFRVLATGRDVSSRTTILSNEISAYQGEAYGVTWGFLLGTANFDTSLGASQSVIHGFPYSDSPTSVWPGFAPFTSLGTSSNGFADAWGPRQPQWLFARNASSYMPQSQALMQNGSASVDIAILNLDWGVTAAWDDAELLAEYSATVRNGCLIPGGPDYKALVLDNVTSLNLDSARDILSYAEEGLPIVIVGSTPNQTQSLCTSCHEASSQLNDMFEAILAFPLVRYTDSDNVTTVTTRRQLQENEYVYWIYSSNRTSQTVYLEGEGYPLHSSLWTGEVSPIASWDTVNGYTAVNVTIGEDAAEAIYLGHHNPYGVNNLERHRISTDAEATENGKYTAHLSTGEQVTVSFDSIPPAITPESWTLTVEDWSPASINEAGRNSSLTAKKTLAPIILSTLLPWNEIPELEFASGVGVYQTANLTTQQEGLGVSIYFGEVGGSWDLRVNSQVVSEVDLFRSAPLDVTPYDRDGENDIEITVATTLWNRLRKTWPDLYGTLEPQQIGLLEPVNFTYYAQQHI
ncbi:hypothetical protein BDW74DRAFT_187585 [Aspergillus multicolor]|uniref:uncharacterized protein n=1 Tax=Aspergillus multicolor TaxID=41759 RepID=UPI003CCE059B